MLVVRLIFVNLFPSTTLKGLGLRPTTHYSMVFKFVDFLKIVLDTFEHNEILVEKLNNR